MLKLAFDLISSNKQWANLINARFIKHRSPIMHYVKSSIWIGLKSFMHTVTEYTSWHLGDGSRINFWHDKWLANPIDSMLGIPESASLQATVSDFIKSKSWNIPQLMVNKFPNPVAEIMQMVIPLNNSEDYIVWHDAIDGVLSFKKAYQFLKYPPKQHVAWGNLIWQQCIPPSKSLVLWGLLHHSLPLDENLKCRGCSLPSMCSLCGDSEESSSHLFLSCNFANSIWSWLNGILQVQQ